MIAIKIWLLGAISVAGLMATVAVLMPTLYLALPFAVLLGIVNL